MVLKKIDVKTPVSISALHTALEAKGIHISHIVGSGEDADGRALSSAVVAEDAPGLSTDIAATVAEVNAEPIIVADTVESRLEKIEAVLKAEGKL